jgi:hypothetical protein
MVNSAPCYIFEPGHKSLITDVGHIAMQSGINPDSPHSAGEMPFLSLFHFAILAGDVGR